MNALRGRSVVVVVSVLAGLLVGAPARATHGGANDPAVNVDAVAVTPESSSLPPGGACVRYTATATMSSAAAENETLDVRVTLADQDATADLTLSFCDVDGSGPLTPIAAPSDTDDEGGTESPATIQGECTTDAEGRCVFGVSAVDEAAGCGDGASGSITVWADADDDGVIDDGEARDDGTVTLGSGTCAIVACTPESVTRPDGSRVEFGCSVTNSFGQPLAGITITVDVNAGPNADEIAPFTCGPTDAQGQTPAPAADPSPSSPTAGACGYNDAGMNTASSPPGTDNVAFCVQAAAPSGQQGTSGCDPHELQNQGNATSTVTWVTPATRVSCVPDGAGATGGTTINVVCTVVDESQAAVVGVVVSFTETGPGSLSATSCTTGLDGSCTVSTQTSSNETGMQTITGSVRSGNCDQSGQPLPGTDSECTDTATIAWSTAPHFPECNDGVDNDGDGNVDLADRGCRDASDDIEADADPSVTLRFRSRRPRGFIGMVSHPVAGCRTRRLVTVRRIGSGVIGRDRTGPEGRYFEAANRRPGRYRARAAARTITIDGQSVTCGSHSSPIIRIRRR
ncbi:MAG: hypothetical protein ACRDKT_12270 [Actinomycetota bacterium]